jgi:hypothetical protein
MVEEKTVCQILSSGEEKITPIKTGCVVLRPQDITILRIIKVPTQKEMVRSIAGGSACTKTMGVGG